jgi:hypothetical protein
LSNLEQQFKQQTVAVDERLGALESRLSTVEAGIGKVEGLVLQVLSKLAAGEK